MTAYDRRLSGSERNEYRTARFDEAVREFHERGPAGADQFRARLHALGYRGQELASLVNLNWPTQRGTP